VKPVGGAGTFDLFRATLALLPNLRVWDGTNFVDPYGALAISNAIQHFGRDHNVLVNVHKEPCKPKAHFAIMCTRLANARADYDKAIEWTAKSGEIVIFTELDWLTSPNYPLQASDVFVVMGTSMAAFVFGRDRKHHWWVLGSVLHAP
jgi:hypothetical protein